MADPDNRILTVSEITVAVKELLEGSFYPFWLTGEIGNLTVHRSGHVYFTLKDARCQISAVYFGGADEARRLKLKSGMEVDVNGRLMVYEPRGNYQITVRRVRAKGLGDLQRQFEALKEALRLEGLFESARKRPLPFLPRCIGVVTSPDGAALHDFLQIIKRRFATMHVRIYPAAVQGERAAPEIARAIRYLNETDACDVIVLTRGGGSIEDLWAFNEEVVARAVAASHIPVVSAVGHEVDFTICDFVADLRVPTPSAAAELVVGGHTELNERLVNLRKRLNAAARYNVSVLRVRVDLAANHYFFREPVNLIRTLQQRIDENSARMTRTVEVSITDYRHRIDQLKVRLRTLNPHNILTRGYAILMSRDSGRTITSPSQVSAGDRVTGVTASGNVHMVVETDDDEPLA